MIKSYGVPDKHTPGNIGDTYQDLSTGNLYRCSAVITNPIEYQFMDIYAKSPKTEYDWNELLKEDTLKAFLDVRGYEYLFYNCYSLTTVPQLDTSNATDTRGMFSRCTSLTTVPQLDTSKVTNMFSMFEQCTSLTTIPQLDTSKVTNMSMMFYNCTSLITIPQLDTSKVTDMSNMFNYCTSLTTVPQLDTRKVTNMNNMFQSCKSLTTIQQLDMINVTSAKSMFYDCYKLITIPQLDTSKVTRMNAMFQNCSSLTTIPQLDTSNVTDMSYMFQSCRSLTTIQQLDMINVNSASSMFYNCVKLTNLSIKNIKVDLQVGSGTSYGHLLTVDSLLGLCKELITASSSKTLIIGSANLNKLANVYVKRITITDEMREDDPLIDQKIPFEVCDSTDNGAVLIKNYTKSKKWTLI